MALSSNSVLASGLEYKTCSFNGGSVYRPIEEIVYLYDELLTLNDSTAALYHGEEIAAMGKLSVNNYQSYDDETGKKWQEGQLVVTFGEALILPKGETYTLVIGKNAIADKDNPAKTNDEIRLTFAIPTDLGEFISDTADGSTLSSATNLVFYWGIETCGNDEKQATLYREGVPVRQFPLYVTSDWDLGQAYVEFGQKLNFENGINFALEIPEGTVYSEKRPDITNKNAVLHFVGGYEEPLPTINYVWCSLSDDWPNDFFGVILFYYDQAVMLSANPVVQLWQGDGTNLVKEVVPTLAEENGKWILKADFEDTPILYGQSYTLVIPDGTLVSASGDVVANSRQTISIDGTNGITNGEIGQVRVIPAEGGIAVSGICKGIDVAVYKLDGTPIYKSCPTADELFVPTGRGVFAVKIGDDHTTKIAVKE